MKHTLLIALLGATVTLATPSLSFADNGHKFKNGSLDQNHTHKYKQRNKSQQVKNDRRHKNDKKRFVSKPKATNRTHKHVNKHVTKKHQVVKNHRDHKKNNNTSFSITWNTGGPIFTYGNLPQNHGYQKPRRHVKPNHAAVIYKRIHNQANRIQNGVRNGQLVNREVRRLQQEQGHIKHTMAQYKRDGRINRHESSRLNQLLDVASNNIYQKTNNHRTRYTQRRNNNGYNNYNNHFVQF